MHRLLVEAAGQNTKIEIPFDRISEYKASLSHPIEIEAFGPQFFFSIMGQDTKISLTLLDGNDQIIDQDHYQLKLG